MMKSQEQPEPAIGAIRSTMRRAIDRRAREIHTSYALDPELLSAAASAVLEHFKSPRPSEEPSERELPRPWPVGALYYIWDTADGRGCRVALDEDLWASVDTLPSHRRAILTRKLAAEDADKFKSRCAELESDLASARAMLDESRKIEKNLVTENDALRTELVSARAELGEAKAIVADQLGVLKPLRAKLEEFAAFLGLHESTTLENVLVAIGEALLRSQGPNVAGAVRSITAALDYLNDMQDETNQHVQIKTMRWRLEGILALLQPSQPPANPSGGAEAAKPFVCHGGYCPKFVKPGSPCLLRAGHRGDCARESCTHCDLAWGHKEDHWRFPAGTKPSAVPWPENVDTSASDAFVEEMAEAAKGEAEAAGQSPRERALCSNCQCYLTEHGRCPKCKSEYSGLARLAPPAAPGKCDRCGHAEHGERQCGKTQPGIDMAWPHYVCACRGAKCDQCGGRGHYLGAGGFENVTCSKCKGTGSKATPADSARSVDAAHRETAVVTPSGEARLLSTQQAWPAGVQDQGQPALPACKRCGKPVQHPAQEYCGAACSAQRGRPVTPDVERLLGEAEEHIADADGAIGEIVIEHLADAVSLVIQAVRAMGAK